MNKFSEGQQLIIERNVVISVHQMNGQEVNEVIEYPKGEVVEILESLDSKNYKIEFWTDSNTLVNGLPVTFEFDEETINDWMKDEVL